MKYYNNKTFLVDLVVVGVLLTVAVAFSLGMNHSPSRLSESKNLIAGYDWSHFAGTKQQNNSFSVSPLRRTIVEQDGSGGQPNPPINLAGPHMIYKGDFMLDLSTSGLATGDTVQLYGGVPIIYDEWRYEPASIAFQFNAGNIEVRIWDGKSSRPSSQKKFQIQKSPVHDVVFLRQGNQISVSADGTQVGAISAGKVFQTKRMWFGFDAGRNFSVKKFSVRYKSRELAVISGLTGNKDQKSNNASLADTRMNKIPKIGSAVSLNPLLTDKKYRALALSQFNIWTPENELKPQFVHPTPKSYTFNEADLFVDTAAKNKIAVHGHALVFGEANPHWMQQAPNSAKRSIMEDHIRTIVGHYQGKIAEWDVINEPLSDRETDYQGGDGLRRHIWYNAMGSEYIAAGLRAAHSADPNAKLYINDYGLEADDERWDAMLALIDKLQAEGVPLDGIGFEAHVHEAADKVNVAVLGSHFAELAARGLAGRISEADVYGDDGEQVQADQYGKLLTACLQAANCTSFSTWGVTDRYGSTTGQNTYPLQFGNDLIWDSSYNSKLAYDELRKILIASRGNYNE